MHIQIASICVCIKLQKRNLLIYTPPNIKVIMSRNKLDTKYPVLWVKPERKRPLVEKQEYI